MKRLVRPLLAGAGVTGALAATNRALGNAPLPINALGGTRVPWTWRGFEIFATEAGEGSPVLLVHGITPGGSSYEYRRLFPLLAQRHRVIAFDLLGCGLSDRPRRAYTAELFVEQICDAIDALCGEPASVVGSSHGAAFAVRAATRADGRIARLAAIAPTGVSAPAERGAVTAFIRTPLLGETAFNVLASRPAIRWMLEHTVYGDAAHVTNDVVDQYYAVAHQPGARYVPAALLGGALACDVARDLPFLDVPLAVLWGENAPASNPRRNADEFVRLARDAQLYAFPDAGTAPHEEAPHAVDDVLAAFFAGVPNAEPALMRQRAIDAS